MTTEFTATAGYDTYIWDFDDGVIDSTSGYTVSHTFSAVGEYNVKLTVWDGAQSNSDTKTVYVYPLPDYAKVICSGVDQSHEESMKAIIEAIYPSAQVTIRIEDISASVIYAKENGYGVICRATTGLSDSRIATSGDEAEKWNIIVIHAHGSNDYIELSDPSYVGSIWAVRNATGSYGAGVEFTIPDVANESDATSTMAGYVSKFMDSYVTTVANLRTLFRDTASNGGVHQNANGYGTVDWIAVESELI